MSLQFGECLFSVHTQLQKDYFGSIEKLAQIGFENIELLAGNFSTKKRFNEGIPVATIKNAFKDFGITPVSTHETIPMGDDLLDQDWDSIIAFNSELGCPRIVIPAVWIKDIEGTKRSAEQMMVLGKKCKKNGIQLYMHTHSHEFKNVNGSVLLDIILDNTSPEYLMFQVDMAWAMRGGIDPVDILQKLGPKCDMVHQKDISKSADPVNLFEVMTPEDDELGVLDVYYKYVKKDDFADLGKGIFDFERVYKKIKEMGHVKYTFAENESANEDRFKSAENDYEVLKKYVEKI